MLSIPLISPRLDADLLPSYRPANSYLEGTPDAQNSQLQPGNRRPGSSQGNISNQNNTTTSELAQLLADENAVATRKYNIAGFGSPWLRPPGVPKTLQAMLDEAAERKEQAEQALRDQVLADLAAAQAEAANREQAAEGQGDETMADERDLDDDIPETEEEESDMSDSELVSDAVEGDISGMTEQADMTFNDESFIEGSVAAEVEHMLDMEDAEASGILQEERDLDDDIPEAGSYEHTDTELDYSSDDNQTEASQLAEGNLVRRHSRRLSRRTSGHRSSGLPSVTTGRRSSGLASGSITRSAHNSVNPSGVIGGRVGNHTGAGRRGRIGSNGSINYDPRNSYGFEGSSSLMEGSSFLHTSPTAARGNLFRSRNGGRN
ncbi:hypothetical protein M011DRAFT_471796 [Sporormia fimetaria CBS 119925]|uniref:Uncharacterized protein n=1 Tax=Sporormia fimetaria CBS 119925 TaxID=1340428 RepID=A0A6A6UYT3_9PLEO|nr:hypothetical protein M011DRAFT_471796 [Sporormia fimetaria CBS 119925]